MKLYSSLILVTISLICLPAHALVKKSNSGICHDESSRSFQQTKHYTPYQSIDECLAAGGRLPKGSSYKAKEKASSVITDEYSRSKFGHGWADVDHDGQNTRQEVLISQNTGNLVFSDNGRVTRGRWVSMYSGEVIVDASKVDIDHVVPLSWAWKHGATAWSQSKREQFANDERNLVAVEASLNRQKGDKGPDEWLPPKNIEQYKARFARIVKIYRLQ